VSVAAELATKDEAVQRKAAAEPEKAPHIAKQERRQEREAELGAKQSALPTQKFG